ncbi:MAG: threonylcarbamoyl-AMP synthase [Methanobacterium sp.]|uniref:L-threonylcarbamoyladenylate synthase n=1 Tax=Methanobacterium sp. TaxID=2164 RepID=UPI003D6487E1|nr:threonylcarbamoyl-AMP synthase [Methanobacterium sp.]
MKLLKINAENPQKEMLKIAIEALNEGKTIIYPTDTVYGIGANIFDVEAVKKVYSVKKRHLTKPLSVCVSKIDDISKIAHVNENIKRKLAEIFPGPFTVILKKKEVVPSLVTSSSDKIGIRIPDNRICMELSREFPITTTSANISGKKVSESVNGVLSQLDNNIDVVLDAGICKHGVHSTVIDMTISPPKILREGASMPSFNYI